MSKNFGIFIIVIFAINLGISILTMNIAAICGWLCALCAQVSLFLNYGDK